MRPTDRSPQSIALVVHVRVFGSTMASLSTDSASIYEVLPFARHFKRVYVHCFRVPGRSRDPVSFPSGVTLVDLGPVSKGSDLYRSVPHIGRVLLRSARSARWTHALIVETGAVPLLALLACRLAGRPAVAALRGDSAATILTTRRFSQGAGRFVAYGLSAMHRISQWVAAHTVPVVVDSEELRQRVERWGGEAKLFIAASVSQREIATERRTWKGRHERPFRLVNVGRLDREKGLSYLVRAVARVRASGRDVELSLVGRGDSGCQAELENLAADLRLSDAISFVGPVPHGPRLLEHYDRADLFVAPSIVEGTPKAILEAFARGLPVLATLVGGFPDVVTSEVGTLVPARDSGALADRISSLYDDPELLAKMSARCCEHALNFTAERVSAELADFLRTRAQVPMWSRTARR
jgi:glycosyltransferase involved in cell wall biosynthesis